MSQKSLLYSKFIVISTAIVRLIEHQNKLIFPCEYIILYKDIVIYYTIAFNWILY